MFKNFIIIRKYYISTKLYGNIATLTPCSCIGMLTIIGQEDTPKVRSLLPVGLGPIYNRHAPNIRISIINSRINVRVIMT